MFFIHGTLNLRHRKSIIDYGWERFNDFDISYAAYDMPQLSSRNGQYDIDRVKNRVTRKDFKVGCPGVPKCKTDNASFFKGA